MPWLVRKNVVLADCAEAGAAARSPNVRAAATGTVFTGKLICSSTWACFCDFARRHCVEHAATMLIPARSDPNEKGAAEPRRLCFLTALEHQLVCWIAESIQSPPRGLTKVQTSVTSTGCSLPLINWPEVMST